jgi:predicted Zn-dependent protease
MKALFTAMLVATAAALWPEFGRYRAEWLLADANARLAAALRGNATTASVESALDDAQRALALLPGDPRPPLAASIALLMLKRPGEAEAVLERALASGERPELTLNLGRARGSLGNESGAQAAFLRTAWASPAAIATLPSSMRSTLLEQVHALEQDLRAGRLAHAPPLD